VAVGDVVYLAEAENDDPTYRLGVVEEVKPGEDGCVHTVSIRYKNPGKEPGKRSPFKIRTWPIHKIAVIVSAGYVFEDDAGGGKVYPKRPRGPFSMRENAETADAQEGDPTQGEDPGELEGAEPRPVNQKKPGGRRNRPNRRQPNARLGKDVSLPSKEG
jgi:hypothetical protein